MGQRTIKFPGLDPDILFSIFLSVPFRSDRKYYKTRHFHNYDWTMIDIEGQINNDFLVTHKQHAQIVAATLLIDLIVVTVLALIILVILCCTRHDSYLCKLCADQGDVLEKTIVPLEEEKSDGK